MLSNSELNPHYGSFSGSDMIVQFIFPGMSPIAIGQASTISYSTFRAVSPVRTLGRISEKGLTKGPRTIAGTIVMTLINRSMTRNIQRIVPAVKNIRRPIKSDELPPFDILISLGNEYGHSAKLVIYGVHIIDDGMIFSSQDLYTENTFTYRARDIELIDGPWTSDTSVSSSVAFMGETEKLGVFNVNTLSAAVDEAERLANIRDYQEIVEQERARIANQVGLTNTNAYPDGMTHDIDLPFITPGVNEATILVQVRDDNGIGQEKVSVTYSLGEESYCRSTDSAGQVFFKHISPGSTVTVSLTSDSNISRTIGVSGGETFDVNLILNKSRTFKFYAGGMYMGTPYNLDATTDFANTIFRTCTANMKPTSGSLTTEDINGYKVQWSVMFKNDVAPKKNISFIGTKDSSPDIETNGEAYCTPWDDDVSDLHEWMKPKIMFNPFSDYNHMPFGMTIRVIATLKNPGGKLIKLEGYDKIYWDFVVK